MNEHRSHYNNIICVVCEECIEKCFHYVRLSRATHARTHNIRARRMCVFIHGPTPMRARVACVCDRSFMADAYT